MAKVFITGITGFLGSNIARVLINNGHNIMATRRDSSSLTLCADYVNSVSWVDQDANGKWIDLVSAELPEVIIHSAWIGVGHAERNDWDSQYQNVNYLNQVLSIAKASRSAKFIGLGSQAEYGTFNGMVTENHPVNPTEAYGGMKVICSSIVNQFCKYHQIDWYWLRLFSFFGKGESDNWLIPAMVKRMQTETEMDFTPGEQKYAYLFVDDLGLAINNIILAKENSGIYNISGKKLLTLKYLIESIRNKVNNSFQLNFGALPYRANQSMHMQGDSAMFVKAFGEFDVSDFDNALADTIEYLKLRFSEKSK